MKQHSHDLVEHCDDALGIGLDRETDEKTIICYLQKFADDTLLQNLVKRLSDQDIDDIAHLIFRILRTHLTESEYHTLFLKDDRS